jgi:hypothetical protein
MLEKGRHEPQWADAIRPYRRGVMGANCPRFANRGYFARDAIRLHGRYGKGRGRGGSLDYAGFSAKIAILTI